MRTFLTFLACSGFIVWAHSCDRKIVGVQPLPATPEALIAKQASTVSPKQQYIKELFSAAALTLVGSNPQLYLVSFRYLNHHHYFSPKTDTLLVHFRPQYSSEQ